MENFIAYNPVKVHFGKNVINDLGEIISMSGNSVLLMYGKGSVLKNGSYRDVKNQLLNSGAHVTEFTGIKPNPVVKDVDEAAALGIRKNADVIVAVGGGSVIDSAKIAGICIADRVNAWDIMTGKKKPEKSLPLIAVLTLAATGTEMNKIAVLQNPVTKEKIGFSNDLMFPAHSFLDPTYTLTVPLNYTSYGIADLTAHALEAYFGAGDSSLSDKFVGAIIKEAIEFGPALLNEPENYELRAKIMWAATNALNGLTSYGRESGDWGVHALGHILSFLYDTPHGATLSIIYPAWLKIMKQRIPDRISELGTMLFNTDHPEATIEKIEDFFIKTGNPVRLQEVGINEEKFSEILNLMNRNKATGNIHDLNDADREEILKSMYK